MQRRVRLWLVIKRVMNACLSLRRIFVFALFKLLV